MDFDDKDLGMIAIVAIVLIDAIASAWGITTRVSEIGIGAIAGFVTGRSVAGA